MADRAGFSATDAALAGFEIARREPLTLVVWSAAQAVLLVPMTLAVRAATAPYQARLQAARGLDPAAAMDAAAHVLPLQLLLMAGLIATFSVIYAGVYRTVLTPSAGGPGRLRLGRDELRVAASLLLLMLLTFAAAAAAVMLALAVAVALSAAAPSLRGLWAAASFVAVFAAMVVLAVRLSLSPPMTFDTGRVTVFGSWRLTRGRFWALFGTYLVAGLLALAVEIALLATAIVLVLLFGGGMAGVRTLLDARGPPTVSAAVVIFQIVQALLSGFVTGLMAGAPAAAYAQLTRGGGAASGSAPASGLPRFGR